MTDPNFTVIDIHHDRLLTPQKLALLTGLRGHYDPVSGLLNPHTPSGLLVEWNAHRHDRIDILLGIH